jgi:hypothetical protein
MPWLPDLRKEDEEKIKEKFKLGLITEKEFKAIMKKFQA